MPSRDYAVLLLISVLIAYVKHTETTRKIDKLRKQIRKGTDRMAKHSPDLYRAAAKLSDQAWENSKEKLGANSTNYAIYIDATCISLYSLIKDPKIAKAWFSEKTFESAMSSMVAASGERKATEAESYALRDMFAKELGFDREISPLALRRKILEQNRILEGLPTWQN